MLTRILHNVTAWLCLGLALATGVTPAPGLVLCVEQDGCVSLELTTAAGQCIGCDAHTLEEPASVAADPATSDPSCACIDFAVPGSTKERALRAQSAPAGWVKWMAMLPASLAPRSTASVALRTPPLEVPRPPDALASIRSVVLRS